LRLLALLLVLSLASCRTLGRRAPEGPTRAEPRPEQTDREPEASYQPPSPEVVAIIDSIRAVVRDSIAAAANDSIRAAAARDETVAAARRDSIEAAAQAAIAAGLRRDSIAAVMRRDSIAAAAQDSIAAIARRDSIAAVVRSDSIAAVIRLDSIAADFRRDSIAAAIEEARVAKPISEDLEELRELGPSYIPYDEGPRVVWDTESQANLTKALLPIVRAEDLVARTRAYFWLLVRADGTVDQTVLQTSSGNASFDARAAEVARQLLFRPAVRAGRAVPTWVVRDISLLM